jgi:hypothetical protein
MGNALIKYVPPRLSIHPWKHILFAFIGGVGFMGMAYSGYNYWTATSHTAPPVAQASTGEQDRIAKLEAQIAELKSKAAPSPQEASQLAAAVAVAPKTTPITAGPRRETAGHIAAAPSMPHSEPTPVADRMGALYRQETNRAYGGIPRSSPVYVTDDVDQSPRSGCILVDSRKTPNGTAGHWRCPKVPTND